MHRSDTYRTISARLGSAAKTVMAASSLEVGDWVQWVVDGHIEAYGAIRRMSGNKATIASAEGMVTAPTSELKLVRKAR